MTDHDGEANSSAPKSATTIIGMFGGIRPMAKKLGIAVTTVQGWKERGVIPAARHADVLQAAERFGIPLTAADMSGDVAAGPTETPMPPPMRDAAAAPSPLARAAAGPSEEQADERRPSGASETPEPSETETQPAAPQEAQQDEPEPEAETIAAAPPETVAPPPRRGRGRAIAALVVLFVAFVAGLLVWRQWGGSWEQLAGLRPAQTSPAAPSEPIATAAELAAAEEEIAAAKTAAGEANAAVAELRAALDALRSELAGAQQQAAAPENLEARLQALEQRGDGGALPANIADRLDKFAQLETRLAALEEAASTTAPGDDGARLVELTGRLEALEQWASGADPRDESPRVAELAGRLEALEQRASAAEPSADDPRVAELTARLAALEQWASGAEPRGESPRVAELAERLQALEQQISTAATGDDGPRLAELEARLASLEQGMAATVPADLGDRLAALDTLETRLSALAAEAKDRSDVAGLEGRVEALESAEAVPPPEPPDPKQGALVVAVGQLRDALRGSGPYAAEMEAVRTLAADDPAIAEALAPLAARADQGIPTAAMLRDQFDARAGAIVRAARLPESPRWYDRALYRLTSLATVRRTGEMDGDEPEALVARAELSLAKGDLAGAVEVLAGLKDRAAAAAKGWLDQARLRLQAEAQLKVLQRAALIRVEDTAGSDAGPASEPEGAAAVPSGD